MKLETLDDLLFEQLRELYGNHKHLSEALPSMASSTSSENLRQAFHRRHEQTREQLNRLESCFRNLGKEAAGDGVFAMKGLIQDAERITKLIPLSPLRDAALIGSARRMEHHEIAAYSTTISLARLLGMEQVADILGQTLREEQESDARLMDIAEGVVNQEARQLGSHQQR